MTPLISCIVPTHNGQPFLADTLRSLLTQTLRPIEIIVVDDSSTDRSFEIAAGMGGPVQVVRIDALNPVSARNRGLSLAKGEYIAFLDHDDLSAVNRLTVQHAALAKDETLDVCVGMIQCFSQSEADAPITKIGEPVPGYLTISMLARREAFKTVGLLNPEQRYSDSAEWFLRARKLECGVRLLPDVVTYHRVHGQNLSLTGNDDARREFVRLIRTQLVSRRFEK